MVLEPLSAFDNGLILREGILDGELFGGNYRKGSDRTFYPLFKAERMEFARKLVIVL